MPKEYISNIITTKKEYQTKLIEILKKYFTKYISNLFDKSLRSFQESLLKIPNWSDDKLDKEFNKFIKFSQNRYNLSEENLSKILSIIIGLNVKIMSAMVDDIELNLPKFHIFWYKSLKRIAKYYYENPKVMLSELEFKKTKHIMEESVNYVLHKYIPLKEILSKKKEPLDMYNFDEHLDESYHSHQSRHGDNQSKDKLEVTLESKTASDHDLKYISSDEFENEYYHSDKEQEVNKKNVEKSEEKHIKLSKYVFPKKNFRKRKVNNEIDEHFFDEL